MKKSRSEMLRYVRARGGYYSQQQKKWILEGYSSNNWPGVEAVVCNSLEEAYEKCDAQFEAVKAMSESAEKEAKYLRENS